MSTYFAETLQAQTLNRPYKTKESHAKLGRRIFQMEKN